MITTTTDQEARVEIEMGGGKFTAVLRTLRERESMAANRIFLKVQQGLLVLNLLRQKAREQKAAGAPEASGESVDAKVAAAVEVTQADIDARIDAADAMMAHTEVLIGHLVDAGALGLKGVEGVQDAAGHPVQLPADLEGRKAWIDDNLRFPQMLDLALAVMSHNTVSERDAGN